MSREKCTKAIGLRIGERERWGKHKLKVKS